MDKKKNNSFKIIVIIIFIIFFIGPIVTGISGLFNGSIVGLFSLIPSIFFFIIFFSIISSFKNVTKSIKKYNTLPDQRIQIPVEFFEQDKPVMEKSSENLFNDLYGRTILYYDNGKPVYEKHEK